MPAVYRQTFEARYYECDAFGYLKNISYLRWMQEAAFAASAAVGYDFSQYHHLGQLWLVRESNIEHFVPLKYGDEIEITTYVKDIRRFRSLRAYELRDTQTGTLVSRATTDWVYLDTETLRPVPIPRKMQLAFFPEGVPQKSLSRQRYPEYPVPYDDIAVSRKNVVWDDLDMMWHVNNANYLNYMDEAEKNALAKSGWSMLRLRKSNMRLYTQQQRIQYLHPAVLDDIVNVETWCSDFKQETALRHYEIRRLHDGMLLIQAHSQWGVCDAETGDVKPIPEGLVHL
jgi:acyl-CoA thioester hydrolase